MQNCHVETASGWQTFANDCTYSISWQIYHFMMSFLLLDLACISICGLIEAESSSNNINDTLFNQDRSMKKATWIFWYLFSFLQPSDASIPVMLCEVSIWDNQASLGWVMRWIQQGQRLGLNVFVRQACSPLLCSPVPWEASLTS